MDKIREDLLNEYQDKINQKGMGIPELWDLRNRILDVVESDYQKTQIMGLDDFSQKRGWFKYGTQFKPDVDDLPYERIQDVKSELAKLKTIMIDPSATVEGANEIIDTFSKYAERDLSVEEALNLARLLGKAEKKGMMSTRDKVDSEGNKIEVQSPKELMYGKTSFQDIVRMVEGKGVLTKEEIEDLAEKLAGKYAEDVGVGIRKAPPPIDGQTPTPHIRTESSFEGESGYSFNVNSPYKFETERNNDTTPKVNPKPINKPIESNRVNRKTSLNSRKTSSARVEHKKVRLSEQSVHKHRAGKSIKVKPKAKRGN